MEYLRALLGISCIVAIAWAFSADRRNISWRLVAGGLLLQGLLGVLVNWVEPVAVVFGWASQFFVKIIDFTEAGTRFLFGNVVMDKVGNIFALKALPTIIFFSTVSAGLHYLGILQKIVYGFAWMMSKTMKLSGAESLSAAGNIFLGQTEAPLMVRPFIPDMTRSELMCLMTGGMATIAGSVLATYVAFLGGPDREMQQQFASFLLMASVMNAPAAIVMAKIIIPEKDPELLQRSLVVSREKTGVNLVDALARGASDGLRLAFNVGAMLLAFIALIAAINFVLKGVIGELTGLNGLIAAATGGVFDGFSLEYLMGNLFRFIAWAIGVDWSETLQVGSLLGKKIVVNEFVAYMDLAQMKELNLLNAKSLVISTFALCGFANFSSIAIQIGGIGGMAPNRQGDISKLGFRALLAGTLATLLTATLAGVLVNP
jgi:concentrative nucleoside transporter, CNT family